MSTADTTVDEGADRVERYRAWLHEQNLRFGFADEIANYCNARKLGVKNDAPPMEMWAKIIPTVRIVEALREEFGPTTILSAFRSKAYNEAVYREIGARPTDSEHSRNTAIDFKCERGTPADWRRACWLRRSQGKFVGGVGIYRTFVHVDTRGRNADWTG